jgi:hypothetical protein
MSFRTRPMLVLALATSATFLACEETEDLTDDAGTPQEDSGSRQDSEGIVLPKADSGSPSHPGSGSGSSHDSGSTWRSDGSTTDATGSGGSGRLILFGGSSQSADLDDTWAWDGSSWTQLNVTGPSARDTAVGGKVGSNIVLFGGDGELSDTWIWDGSSWTQSTATGPTGTDGNVAATLGSDLLLFYTDESGSGHTWSFDGSAWSQLSNASGPYQGLGWAAVTFQNVFSLFGNQTEWTWSGSFWNQASMVQGGPTTPSPSAELNAAQLGSLLVVFDGEGDGFGDMNQTWTWDGTNWTLQNVNSPSARSYASMATYKNTVVLFGGCDYGFDGVDGGTTCLDDTWTWDGSIWTQHFVSGPSPRANAFLVAE